MLDHPRISDVLEHFAPRACLQTFTRVGLPETRAWNYSRVLLANQLMACHCTKSLSGTTLCSAVRQQTRFNQYPPLQKTYGWQEEPCCPNPPTRELLFSSRGKGMFACKALVHTPNAFIYSRLSRHLLPVIGGGKTKEICMRTNLGQAVPLVS